MYSEGITDQNYLRGVQVADADGTVSFTSIFPACYSGRWPHVHFEVYPDVDSITDSTNAIAASQVALPEDVCATVYATTGYERSVTSLAGVTLASDNVLSDDAAASRLAAVAGTVSAGYAVSLTAGVDTTTTPTSGSAGPARPRRRAPGRTERSSALGWPWWRRPTVRRSRDQRCLVARRFLRLEASRGGARMEESGQATVVPAVLRWRGSRGEDAERHGDRGGGRGDEEMEVREIEQGSSCRCCDATCDPRRTAPKRPSTVGRVVTGGEPGCCTETTASS